MDGTSTKRVAVVTGGNKGIGLGVCKALAKLPDMVVILTSRSEADGRAAVASLEGAGVLDYHQLDVASDESVATFKKFVEAKYGRVDVLVNNAGNLMEGYPSTVSTKDFNDMLNVHVTGSLRMTQVCLPLMKKHGYGRIINMTSGVAQLCLLEQGGPSVVCGYAIAKLALNGLTLLTAAEVKPEENILVNAIMPGFVKTDLSSKVVPDDLPQKLGTRWRTADEVGQDVVYLVTQAADGPRGKLYQENQPQPW